MPRLDGKKICNELRRYRVRLAKKNGIKFESPECPSDGPCAGTCKKCDEEANYLREQLGKKKNPIYPKMNVVGDSYEW